MRLAASTSPYDGQSYNGLKVRFSATLGEKPEVALALVYRLGAGAVLTALLAMPFSEGSRSTLVSRA